MAVASVITQFKFFWHLFVGHAGEKCIWTTCTLWKNFNVMHEIFAIPIDEIGYMPRNILVMWGMLRSKGLSFWDYIKQGKLKLQWKL
jgi:hypothetical protein